MANRAFDNVWKSITLNLATDMTNKNYRFMTYDSSGNGIVAPAGKSSVGVLYEPNNVNQASQVVASGYAFITIGATLTAGQDVEVGTDGKAKPFATGVKVGICAVGGDADSIGTILLDR